MMCSNFSCHPEHKGVDNVAVTIIVVGSDEPRRFLKCWSHSYCLVSSPVRTWVSAVGEYHPRAHVSVMLRMMGVSKQRLPKCLPHATKRWVHGVQVKCHKITRHTSKGGTTHFFVHEGTFITRDGALFVLPPSGSYSTVPTAEGRRIEERMLRVLFEKHLRPKEDPTVARLCETPEGLRSEFSKMCKTLQRKRSVGLQTTDERRYDCLLLVKGGRRGRIEARKVGSSCVIESENTNGRVKTGVG